ncbi:hypothetical protein RRG08_034793 [Elysia crispata]|uniref:Uncharacterized protein n=1 Tax=Elysia crispata TaxID=231223 RepID=A0AAE0YAG2_9GAST|nr:hypothetical protein RRG08_034793 [Elysia crispata]
MSATKNEFGQSLRFSKRLRVSRKQGKPSSVSVTPFVTVFDSSPHGYNTRIRFHLRVHTFRLSYHRSCTQIVLDRLTLPFSERKEKNTSGLVVSTIGCMVASRRDKNRRLAALADSQLADSVNCLGQNNRMRYLKRPVQHHESGRDERTDPMPSEEMLTHKRLGVAETAEKKLQNLFACGRLAGRETYIDLQGKRRQEELQREE